MMMTTTTTTTTTATAAMMAIKRSEAGAVALDLNSSGGSGGDG
jgi:hypothetical protein